MKRVINLRNTAFRARVVFTAAVMSFGAAATARAQETVRISVPSSVSFTVVNVGIATSASPSWTSMTFTEAALTSGHAVRVSVRAEGNLIPPSGPSIPASNVSWTTSNVSGGVAVNGTLSATAYNQVFESQVSAVSGGCDLAWTLAAPGTPLRAGIHQVTLRWKLESIVP